jgi:hypothetical protein
MATRYNYVQNEMGRSGLLRFLITTRGMSLWATFIFTLKNRFLFSFITSAVHSTGCHHGILHTALILKDNDTKASKNPSRFPLSEPGTLQKNTCIDMPSV